MRRERHFRLFRTSQSENLRKFSDFPLFPSDFRAPRETLFSTKSHDSANLDPPRRGLLVAQWGRPRRYHPREIASPDRRISGPPDDRALVVLGVRRGANAFTILEESAARPPHIPAPRAAMRSKLCVRNDASAPLPNV